MRHIENNEYLKTRNSESNVVLPKRLPGTIFQGWGPKLMVAAFATGTLALWNVPARADADAAKPSCVDREAKLVSSPSFSTPEGQIGGVETILRIDLAADGKIRGIAVAKSSGNPRLDFEAARIARQSKYSAETLNCGATAGSYLEAVDFVS